MPPLLEMIDITKRFPGVLALDKARVSVEAATQTLTEIWVGSLGVD